MSGSIRKQTMRCTCQADCNLCPVDCRRAEIIAHENEIRDDLLAVCERYKKRMDSGGLIDKDCTGLYNCLDAALKKARKA